MTWAERLKRVFNIDVTICSHFGGAVNIIPNTLTAFAGLDLACIEGPLVIKNILAHLDAKSGAAAIVNQLQEPRAKLFT